MRTLSSPPLSLSPSLSFSSASRWRDNFGWDFASAQLARLRCYSGRHKERGFGTRRTPVVQISPDKKAAPGGGPHRPAGPTGPTRDANRVALVESWMNLSSFFSSLTIGRLRLLFSENVTRTRFLSGIVIGIAGSAIAFCVFSHPRSAERNNRGCPWTWIRSRARARLDTAISRRVWETRMPTILYEWSCRQLRANRGEFGHFWNFFAAGFDFSSNPAPVNVSGTFEWTSARGIASRREINKFDLPLIRTSKILVASISLSVYSRKPVRSGWKAVLHVAGAYVTR